MIFATGNQYKLEEARLLLGQEITQKKLELPEIQGDHIKIALQKIETAYSILKEPVFIDDTCLIFNAFGELPGPYIKDFVKNIGTERLPLLLERFPDKSARAVCTIAYHDGKKAHVFEGVTLGKIVSPRGGNRFDWDKIFQPEGFELTYAEMELSEKNKISHRKKAFLLFKEFLGKNI